MIAGLFKTMFRVGLITAACGGAAVLIAGEERVGALISTAHHHVVDAIDSNIDDPTALRKQLREMEREYPERISQVRGDLAELNQQIAQLEKEQAIAERVVALAEQDVAQLAPLLDEAQVVGLVEHTGYSEGVRNVVSIRFDNRTWTVSQAANRLQQINQTKVAYANRAADSAHDLVYLRQQGERLDELMAQLEGEQAQFQSQLWQLDRQVDSIARNERLIDMLGKRNRTLDECSRYEAVSFDQLRGKLDEVRARQQASLDQLTGEARQMDYEDVAKMQLQVEDGFVRAEGLEPLPEAQSLVLSEGQPRGR